MEIIEQQLIKAQPCAFRHNVRHVLPRTLLFRREPVRAVGIIPDIACQLADGGIRHMRVGIQAVMQRADARDGVVARAGDPFNGTVRHTAASHRAAVDRPPHL